MTLLTIVHDKLYDVFAKRPSPYSSQPEIMTPKRYSECDGEDDFLTMTDSNGKRKRGPCDSMSPLKLPRYRQHREDMSSTVRNTYITSTGTADQDGEDDEQMELDQVSGEESSSISSENVLDDDEADATDSALSGIQSDEDEEPESPEDNDTLLSRVNGNISSMSLRHLSSTPISASEDSDSEADYDGSSEALLESEASYTAVRPRELTPPPLRTDLRDILANKRQDGWSEDHLNLLSHLYNRGHEQIAPLDYQKSLAFLPSCILGRYEQALILDARTTPSSHAERALEHLLKLGGHIRNSSEDRANDDLQSEKWFRYFVTPYLDWSIKDTGLSDEDSLPIVTSISAGRHRDPAGLKTKAQRAMRRLTDKHAAAYKHNAPLTTPVLPPTLYLIASVGLQVVLLAKPPQSDQLQVVDCYDFTSVTQDVWNVIALALVACHGRDIQMARAAMYGPTGIRIAPHKMSDPDA